MSVNFCPFASVPVSLTTRDFPSFATVSTAVITTLPAFVATVLFINWLIGQHVESWAPFDLIWLAIEFPHPGPVNGLPILIHAIYRALYHVIFGWGVGDHGIFGCAGRELRFGFVELLSAHERIGSKGGCGCC